MAQILGNNDGGGGGFGGGAGTAGSVSPATGSTPGPAVAVMGGGGGFASIDIPLVGNGAVIVQAPSYEVPDGCVVEISPNPNNAADFKVAESPGALAGGPYRTIKATANPISIYVRNTASLFGLGNAADYVILTVKRR